MSSTPYVLQLAARLRDGLERLGTPFRSRQTDYLLSSQKGDGGFAGRRGNSDLYYTCFALRAADALNVCAPEFWRSAAAFVRKNSTEPEDVTDCLGLLTARTLLAGRGQTLWCEACTAERVEAVRATLERFHVPLGGFAKTTDADISLYHTFLGGLCCGLLGEVMPDAEAVAALVVSRQLSDGGFGDLGAAEVSGTNQTAAAVGALRLVGALGDISARAAAVFLLAQQRPDGGFAAHSKAPVSDLMSTFTALVTLSGMGSMRDVRLSAVGRYVKSLDAPAGGFFATESDDAADVEYTYYGLGTLALLAEQIAARG